jgi:beta-glucosidase
MDYKDILSKLTVDEKIKLTSGTGTWDFFGVKRLGIRAIKVADGPHGVRVNKKKLVSNEIFGNENLEQSTMFPSAVAMASTFNPDLIFKVGETIGKECNMFEIDILLAPGVNSKRSPLGGRNFEYYSEDPFLTGEIATSYINGVQSTGVGACIKHYALNEQETQRRFIDTVLDERTLFEFYLAPFEKAIKNANPYTIMTSYNRVLGDYAGESKFLLKDVLRDIWEYDGAVMSDWGGVQNKVKSIKNGMNLEMPGTSEFEYLVKEALNTGDLTIEDIDNSLVPLFVLFDKLEKNTNKGVKTSLLDNHKIANSIAEQGIVLLENDGVLPISKDKTIGVVGNFASNPRINGGGSASLNPFITEIPIDELNKVYDCSFTDGYMEESTSENMLSKIEETVKDKDVVLFFTGSPKSYDSEGYDRAHMLLPSDHILVFEEILKYNKNVVVILNNGSALDISPLMKARGIIEAWFLGGANSNALVKIISGEISPSGRLSETFPLNIESTPHYGSFPSMQDTVEYYGDIMNVGYRYYDTHKYPVRYPFGYGLSYSKFEYSNLELNKDTLINDFELEVKLTVKNSGDYDSFETVQLYVSNVVSHFQRPLKELKGFKKVYLKKGEEKDVILQLDKRSFSIYSVDFKDFRIESGEFEIMIGRNVNEILLSKTIMVQSDKPVRKSLTMDHPFNNWELYYPNKVKYLEETYRKIEWYEKEEPIGRVLRRLKRHFNINKEDFNQIINKLK